jgi:uncharacterized repeat protein (TIGR03837 family)
MQWDVFCRVIDNFGDIGVCWRLAADLGARGQAVRLWVDDASALTWMAPDGASGVTVRHWNDAAAPPLGDVVVEAFGCDLPPDFVAGMTRCARPPVWINLEYLSAEAYVQRSHGLPSPQLSGAGAGLTKWFYYPGFGAGTGGLIREPGLLHRQQGFDAAAWLTSVGCERRPHERVVSLFCYPNPRLPELLDTLTGESTLLLAAAGAATQQVVAALGTRLQRGALRAHLLPWISQNQYDHVLWASDLNFVRGEDSFVRAQWAGKPFVWEIYPQHDGAHAAKLKAFVDLFVAGSDDPRAARALWPLWAAWNGLSAQATSIPLSLPPMAAWQCASQAWRTRLLALPDLSSQLHRFASERR